MGPVQELIEIKLTDALIPEFLEVVNESHGHCHSENRETHFKITAVSAAFEGLSPVKRHQQLYGLLADELIAGVHALAFHLYTPAEWERRNQVSPESTHCVGH